MGDSQSEYPKEMWQYESKQQIDGEISLIKARFSPYSSQSISYS